MNSKGVRRKKSSLSEVKVAVIGAPGVGKSGEFCCCSCGNWQNIYGGFGAVWTGIFNKCAQIFTLRF